MFAAAGPAISVSGAAQIRDFPSYLRASANSHTNFIDNRFWVPQRPPPLRIMAVQQYNAPTFSTQPPREAPATTSCDPYQQQYLTQHSNGGGEGQTLFDDFVHYPDDTFAPMKLDAMAPVFQQAIPAALSFRPLTPGVQTHATTVPPGMPCKIENGQDFQAPAVLPSEVDPSSYEPVAFDECMMASPSSPSSVDSQEFSPLTLNADAGCSFREHYFNNRSLGEVQDNLNNLTGFGDGSFFVRDRPETRYPGLLTTPSTGFDESLWLEPTQLFSNDVLWNPAHTLPVTPEYNIDKIETMSASPQDIDRPLSAQSNDGVEDSPPGTPASSVPSVPVNDKEEARLPRDRYLLEKRKEGLSYKEIKREGHFTEAESTLRGRVRVLTKAKIDRVRKPHWTAKDVCCWLVTSYFSR